MGLYIKDMEMPNENDSIHILRDGTAVVYRTESIDFYKAIAVSDHGRLIDADAMFKDICDSINEMTAIGVAVDGQWLWGKLNDALENVPTIIPASGGKEDE